MAITWSRGYITHSTFERIVIYTFILFPITELISFSAIEHLEGGGKFVA